MARRATFGTDVAAEQVPQPFAFGEPCDHLVESALQSPDFGALVHADGVSSLPLFDLGHRVDDLTNRIRDRPRRQDHYRQAEKHRGGRHDEYRDFDGCVLVDDPAVRLYQDESGDDARGKRGAQHPHADKAGCTLGTVTQPSEPGVVADKNRAKRILREQQPGADRGGGTEDDTEKGRHRDSSAGLRY